MKRLGLLFALALSACTQLPTETASRAPSDARADGGMTLGGGQYTPPPCKDESGQPVQCP
jgi:hypothetical protein